MPSSEACELCAQPGGREVWRDALCRVVRVDDPDYPGFCRVVLHDHVGELSDLPPARRAALMTVVAAVEQALRRLYAPHKINLASLGNVVPHLHWHVIPRFADDRHFPRPIWAEPLRAESPARAAVGDAALADAIRQALPDDQGVVP